MGDAAVLVVVYSVGLEIRVKFVMKPTAEEQARCLREHGREAVHVEHEVPFLPDQALHLARCLSAAAAHVEKMKGTRLN